MENQSKKGMNLGHFTNGSSKNDTKLLKFLGQKGVINTRVGTHFGTNV